MADRVARLALVSLFSVESEHHVGARETRVIIGLHCSIREGYLAALDHAALHSCRAMQMFSYRRHHSPAAEELSDFSDAIKRRLVQRLVVHVRYLPQLASHDAGPHRHSLQLLAREISLSAQLGAEGLIVHAGAYPTGSDARRGMVRFADGVAEAKATAGENITILIENVPGGGRRMGGSLEEIAELASLMEQRGVSTGFCLDTAHAWAQGYDIASAEGMWRFVAHANRILGAERIRAFHLNDTRSLLGSHRENHAHWKQGYLGTEGLSTLLGRSEFSDAVGILETPAGYDAENLRIIRDLMK